MADFNEKLALILSKIKAEKKLLYLLGDYNINLLNSGSHSQTDEFLDIMFSHSLLPTITKPTRITRSSATLIDNIFCNSLLSTENVYCGILCTDISDHLPIFHIDYSCEQVKEKENIMRRSFNEKNTNSFFSALSNHNWNHVISQNDAQLAYSTFLKEYVECSIKAFL